MRTVWQRESPVRELILDKKIIRRRRDSAVSEAIIIKMGLRKRQQFRGTAWTEQVAEYFMELYPEMLELGYLLDDLPPLSLQDEL